ncbi:MAG: hypothetical protein EOO61_11045 [Hymenobacter sp.]|nr:MAG: hypothetical protein EOO61_11045 [Hymenobacter sp.]
MLNLLTTNYLVVSKLSKKRDDFYRVLGLPFGASMEQVRKAYREYAKHFHPDKHQNSIFLQRDLRKFSLPTKF